ncbi:hypothetical protein [Aliikangiella maris]|uniref:Uncharacterized protein n=2 Tax=Aliikangiella maris TaxID=3162458 RepID=A0ABV2BUC7_9GAMM
MSWNKSQRDLLDSKSRLQLSHTPEFVKIERTLSLTGNQKISLSGFNDGQYYFRLVDSLGNPLSNVATVTVNHRDFYQALSIFALGACLFIVLVLSIFLPRQLNQPTTNR